MRRVTRRLYWSSSFVPRIACRTRLTAAITSEAEQRVPERVDVDVVGQQLVRGHQQPGVREQDEQEPRHEREREPQRREDRREHGVHHGDERRHEERRAGLLEPDPGTIAAAIHTAAAPTAHETSVRSSPRRGVAGCQVVPSP